MLVPEEASPCKPRQIGPKNGDTVAKVSKE